MKYREVLANRFNLVSHLLRLKEQREKMEKELERCLESKCEHAAGWLTGEIRYLDMQIADLEKKTR